MTIHKDEIKNWEDRFDRFEQRAIRIITIALTCIGLVVTIEGGAMAMIWSNHQKQVEKLETLDTDFFLYLSGMRDQSKNVYDLDGIMRRHGPVLRGYTITKEKLSK